jgi:hypothetical protein
MQRAIPINLSFFISEPYDDSPETLSHPLVWAGTLDFPLLLKVTILFKYNLNEQGVKGPCHQFKLISPTFELIGI